VRKLIVGLLVAGASASALNFNEWLAVNGANKAVYLRQKEDGHRWTWDILQTEVWAWRFAVGAEVEFNHPRRAPFVGADDIEGNDLVQRYARYRDNTFDVRAGTFDKTLGKGLVLRSYLDRDYDVYNLLDGATASATGDFGGRQWGDVTALWGRNDRRDEDLQQEYDKVMGGAVTFRPVDFAYLMGEGAEADVENFTTHELVDEKLVGGGVGGGWRYFDLYAEYALRQGFNAVTNEDDTGRGLYGVVNGYLPRSSLSVEYKRYADLAYPYSNPPPASVDNRMITGGQSPSRGEWGYYVRASGNPWDPVRVIGGYSYADDKVGEVTTKGAEIEEYTGSVRYDTPLGVVVEPGFESLTDVTYSIVGKAGDKRDIPSLKASWGLGDDHSFSVEGERESRKNYTVARTFTDNRFSTAYNYSSWLGVTVAYEDTDERVREVVELGPPPVYRYKHNWLWGEVRLTWFHHIFQNHVLTLGYGSRRGGLVCSSGMCVRESPFSGAKVALESSF